MIELSRLNGKVFYLNHNLIEIFESTPDTVIKLTDGTKYIVREKPDELIAKIVAFNRQIFAEKTRTE
jgi:flagellar protein FlbD